MDLVRFGGLVFVELDGEITVVALLGDGEIIALQLVDGDIEDT
jgi:hypothetical protein